MILYSQTVAGAADFDGAAAATGLLNFAAHYNFGLVGQDVVPVIYSLGLTLAAAAAGRIRVELFGGAGTVMEELFDVGALVGVESVSYSPEHKRIVQRDGTGNPWQLRFITTKGGAGDGTAWCHWRPERAF